MGLSVESKDYNLLNTESKHIAKHKIFGDKNMKKKISSIFAILFITLLGVSTFAFLTNSVITAANAQTSTGSTIPSNLLQYEWWSSAADGSRTFFNPGPGPTTPYIQWRTTIPHVDGPPSGF